MISWEIVIWPVLAFIVSGLAGPGYAAWRDLCARHSVAAVTSGRRVAVPMTIEADGVVRGRGVRDGNDLRIVARGHHLLVDREELRASRTRRGQFDDGLFEYAELVGLVDDSGRRYYVGPPQEWAPAFRATLETPARSAGGLWRLWAAAPRVALEVVAAALLLGGVFQVADVLRALAPPLDGALDHDGFFGFFTMAPGALAAAGLMGAAGLGVRRLRRPAVRLRARAREEQPGDELPMTATEAEGMPFRALAAAVAEREGWGDDVAGEPPAARWWDPMLMALGSARWLPVAGLLGVAWLPQFLPRPLRLALTAGAGVVLVWALWRSVTTYLVVRRPFGQPVTSEWDYHLVRTDDGQWVVLLLLGDIPHWAMSLEGGEAHPCAVGRCGVRGDLEEGGAVHVRIMDRFWVPSSPVIRVLEDFREDVREDLVSRLVGDPAGVGGFVAHTVAS